MTLLELVNKINRRLRYSTVSSVNQNAFSQLIVEYANDTKREVEDSYPWNRLQQTVRVTTSNGFPRYQLTDAGDQFRILKDTLGRWDVYNDTDEEFLHMAPSTRWMTNQFNHDPEFNKPLYFELNGKDNFTGDPLVDLYPIPDKEYIINFNLLIPQADLVNNEDSFLTPEYPILLGTWARILQDRGEDGGNSALNVWAQYQRALSDSIVIEDSNSPEEESVWWVV